MKTQPYNFEDITPQQHATFEREGWGIFNGDEVQRIDDPEAWGEGRSFVPTILRSDMAAKKLAIKHGFIFGDLKNKFTITEVIIKN